MDMLNYYSTQWNPIIPKYSLVTNYKNCREYDSSCDPTISDGLILGISEKHPNCDYKNSPEFLSAVEHAHGLIDTCFIPFEF